MNSKLNLKPEVADEFLKYDRSFKNNSLAGNDAVFATIKQRKPPLSMIMSAGEMVSDDLFESYTGPIAIPSTKNKTRRVIKKPRRIRRIRVGNFFVSTFE
jgi:hypothetical protein